MSNETVWNQETCTEITEYCPVELSVYGYHPDIGANGFFLGFFALFALINLGLGIRYRTWSYMVALTAGCVCASIGYVGRIILHDNPFNDSGFITQICCLIIAPAFNSAAIYLTLKHMVLCFGEEFSVIKARFYTYIFISADLLSLVLQGAGGGIASTADDDDPSMQQTGDDLLMAGIAWQVVALFFFGCMAGWYVMRRWKAHKQHPLSPEAATTIKQRKFRLFAFGVGSAWFAIFIRCIYRIVEMAGGWGNDVMQDEATFIVFEGCFMVYATIVQTVFHPGFCFPRLSSSWTPAMAEKNSQDVSMESVCRPGGSV
ncbi:hypothetical protein G647_06869 [Cladophialophora carrionii CBS 160.54]|uniref:RTA1 domain protein n=1 Tax=Cladophialophora carrionii CBS 160.54 TaxID=1279043 RepID=V9D8Z7_9EURO|nr:uncharacterized protein G647_06869 [Cladophialophora carrionii CBS 160.54]ETI22793.1 hypothetical protein G647_06869 [Cladophialophora carrionii CBS 160.54]